MLARETQRVLVRLREPPLEQQDALSSFVVASVEHELAGLGAAPAGFAADDSLESIVRDQLYRARLLGCSGIALHFGSLRSLADAGGHLGHDDSDTLRRLLALAEREPLQLYLPEHCAALLITGNPEPLASWLPAGAAPGRVARIEYDMFDASVELGSDLSAEITLLPPALEAFLQPVTGASEHEPVAAAPSAAAEAASAAFDEVPTGDVELDVALEDATSEACAAVEAPFDLDAAETQADDPPALDARADDAAAEADAASADGGLDDLDPHGDDLDELQLDDELDAVTPAPAPCAPVPLAALEESAPASVAPPPPDPQRAQRAVAWAAQLSSMHGPKSHSSVEKAFLTAYLPLRRELLAGGLPPETAAAAERWAEGFAQSYASAFRMLGSRARRPRMVRDVVDVGVRWLGQHCARQCQLLLVSAMRFDLAQRLNEELERRLANSASCVDQCVLWAALPSNAEAQQLGASLPPGGRGAVLAPRSSGAEGMIESMSFGNRELFKLNHVPRELAKAGELESSRLDRLATELADRILPWMRQQPQDTLIVIFGDHGFHWESDARGTSPAQRGGAFPEQVLVSAAGWLLREPRRPRTAPGVH